MWLSRMSILGPVSPYKRPTDRYRLQRGGWNYGWNDFTNHGRALACLLTWDHAGPDYLDYRIDSACSVVGGTAPGISTDRFVKFDGRNAMRNGRASDTGRNERDPPWYASKDTHACCTDSQAPNGRTRSYSRLQVVATCVMRGHSWNCTLALWPTG